MFFYSICVHLLRYSSRTGLCSILFADTMHIKICSSLIICPTQEMPDKYTNIHKNTTPIKDELKPNKINLI